MTQEELRLAIKEQLQEDDGFDLEDIMDDDFQKFQKCVCDAIVKNFNKLNQPPCN